MTGTDRLLARLSRRTTSGQFIPEIDGLRFVSIALVVLFHLNGFTIAKTGAPGADSPVGQALARLMGAGHYGVQLFFIISGFVLALPFAAHHLHGRAAPQLRTYYLRRLTRLEPPYIIAMVGIFLLAVAGYHATARALGPHLLASLSYTHNLIYGTGSTLNVVAWSLEIEVQFYILAPFLARLFSIRSRTWRRVAVSGVIVSAILAQLLGATRDPRLSLTLLNYIQFFLIGFLLADLYLTEWTDAASHRGLWDIAGALAWLSLAAACVFDDRPAFLLPVLAFGTFCATFRGNVLRRLMSNRWLTTIGGMCYSIYLLHYPFISALGRHTTAVGSALPFAGRFAVQFLIMIPMLLLVSVAYFALIERPCMNRNWPHDLMAWVRGSGRRAGDMTLSSPRGS